MLLETSTQSYFMKSSFLTVFAASILFCIDNNIDFTFMVLIALIGGSFFLAFIFGQITTKIFDNHLTSNYPLESIAENFETISATRTKYRYISVIPIFIITVMILNILLD